MALLLVLMLAPVAAALLAGFLSGRDQDSTFKLGLILSLVIAVLGLPLVLSPGTIDAVRVPWFTLWGTGATVHLSLASDGLSAWLIQLVLWLTPAAILGAKAMAGARMREFLVCAFAAQAAMIGALLARDLVVFFLFYEAMLIPAAVLIALFGGSDRRNAAGWFTLYTMLGGVGMLVGIWYIAAHLHSTELDVVRAGMGSIPPSEAGWLFLGFVLAFAVKVPLVPLHGWQARTYSESAGPVVVILGGAMSKLGVYGFLRFVLPLFPGQMAEWGNLLMVLALIGTVGGALVAIVQDDAKRMLAYSSLSHLSLIMVGIFAGSAVALDGAAVQMVAHGLSAAALFLLVGVVERQGGFYGLDDYGALAERVPLMAVLFVGAALASAAMPGTINFVGEFLLLLGTYQRSGLIVASIAGLSVILGVVYLLILIQRWFYGKPGHASEKVVEISAAEAWAVGLLVAATLFFGFYPRPILDQTGPAVRSLMAPAKTGLPSAVAVVPVPANAAH